MIGGGYGPEHVNVADAKRDPDSLLTFMQLLIRRYRECPELGWGRFELLEQPARQVLAHRCSWESFSIVALHNLGGEALTVPLALTDDAGNPPAAGTVLVDLLQDGRTELKPDGSADLALDAYGYR